jgi:cell division septum initiation protein DivIVA
MLGIDLSLSLSRQAMMQHQRQRAARLSRNELAQWCDELIQRAHQQEHLIIELQKAAANLMVQLALKDAPPLGEPNDQHHQWAREVLGRADR